MTSVGEIRIVWTQKGNASKILRILLPRGDQEARFPLIRTLSDDAGRLHDGIDRLCLQIPEFLSGRAVEFSLKEIDMTNCSLFQRKVLFKTCQIPRGQVMSYGHLAEAIGIPEGARAVGMALSRNPFPLVIPCHRIVRATGDLGGFGGGLTLKKTLLEMERVTFEPKGRVSRACFFC